MLTACMQANNPVRSRAHDNATGTIASGLDMWHDAHSASQAARFASHSAWELQHDDSITKEQARQGSPHTLPSFLCPPPSLSPLPPLPSRLAPSAPLACVLPGSCCMMTVSARSKPGKALPPPPPFSPHFPVPLLLCWELQHDDSISKGQARQASATLHCAALCRLYRARHQVFGFPGGGMHPALISPTCTPLT